MDSIMKAASLVSQFRSRSWFSIIMDNDKEPQIERIGESSGLILQFVPSPSRGTVMQQFAAHKPVTIGGILIYIHGRAHPQSSLLASSSSSSSSSSCVLWPNATIWDADYFVAPACLPIILAISICESSQTRYCPPM
uniref:HDC10502 n=1 Tax=Drosophila melanogaster TaxID=7227 RepID=Q6IL37_DROME|nr:TPA_inf: HDC10502 [Drosophila melanogaster]